MNQYADLQQFEHASPVTTLPIIQTNADGEDVYHAGLEAHELFSKNDSFPFLRNIHVVRSILFSF